MNRKTIIWDVFAVMIIVFAMIIGTVIIRYVITEVQDTDMGQEHNDILVNTQNAITMLDYLPLLAIGLFVVLGLITLSSLNTHPAWMIIGIVFLFIAVLVSAGLSDFAVDLRADPDFNDSATSLPVGGQVATNLPVIIFGVGIVFLMFMYAKGRTG